MRNPYEIPGRKEKELLRPIRSTRQILEDADQVYTTLLADAKSGKDVAWFVEIVMLINDLKDRLKEEREEEQGKDHRPLRGKRFMQQIDEGTYVVFEDHRLKVYKDLTEALNALENGIDEA